MPSANGESTSPTSHRRGADTIRVLVASDNHVGAFENDPVRGDDSWRAFDEVLRIARARDVDMVLLAGDLFHDHHPSQKSLYHVMRSLRQNCLGDKPCELEMLSDASEHFDANFSHPNYEDQDINISIPVFSIHGNHDDPVGLGRFASLDLLQMAGLMNYYGKAPEADKIRVKPVLLQKGQTKLALYGLSYVRDPRLYRTFRRGDVKFFRPSQQKDNWFNLLSVHQNHHQRNDTEWLPEKFLPDFMQLVIWGHEHECEIEPKKNFEQGFHVMQPGSSIATSLVPGEAVRKHVAILSITGKDFKTESIPLKTVRPCIVRSIALRDEPGMEKIAKTENNRTAITRHIEGVVDEMIKQVQEERLREQGPEDLGPDGTAPLPLVRLRVDFLPPESGGRFDIENASRLSNRFADRVANTGDVVDFHMKKHTTRRAKDGTLIPDDETMAQMSEADNLRVEKLVREYLQAQSLTILPQNLFGDAVGQFIDKDDKHAMESFVDQSLKDQIKNLMGTDDAEFDEDDILNVIGRYRADIEDKFNKGQYKVKRKTIRLKPKPADWDSDFDGAWDDAPQARITSDVEDGATAALQGSPAPAVASAKGRGRGRSGKTVNKSSRTTANATASSKPARGSRAPARGGRRGAAHDEDGGEDDDVVMLDDDDNDGPAKTKPAVAISTRKPPARSSRKKQTTLSFSSRATSQARTGGGSKKKELVGQLQTRTLRKPTADQIEQSDDEISDDDDDDDDDDDEDAFEPMTAPRAGRKR